MDLKPCPKCGSERIIYLNCVDRLKCKGCGYKGATSVNRAQAIESWNRNRIESIKDGGH